MYTVEESSSSKGTLVTIYGNSNDVKPTDNIADGSIFIETDTLYIYMFDKTNTTWRQLA